MLKRPPSSWASRALFVVLWLLATLPGCDPAAPPPPPPPQPTATLPEVGPVPLGRLPADVRPTHYSLSLRVVPSDERYEGTIAIDLALDRPRHVIWLHGDAHEVSEVVAEQAGRQLPGRYEQVDAGGVVKVTLPEALAAGAAKLTLRFSTPFSLRNNGIYKVESGGDAYVMTQMEPVWTRRAFPCFNEPAFKVPWDVSLTVRKDQRAVANTRELERTDAGDGMTTIRFATTEPLPSYLIALAVGPLDIVEAPDIEPSDVRARPIPFRGIAVKGRGGELRYALENTPPILAELERYFGIAYPYDKLDVIAVPEKGGAMENPGLVTFREWLLLLEESTAPIDQQRAFAYVMAHELAHMWFGDLVTMPWWDDIWLNEAFATWMGYRAVHAWRPEHQADVSQLSGVYQAMSVDKLISARQIRQPVENNDDIHNAFDRITYRKGGGVLSMFERWLEPEVFRRGLSAYMKKHAHGSATADDLLAALSEAANKDVATPFRTFLFQPGLPHVEAEVSCGETAELKLKQSRYLPLGSKGDPNMLWQIPICVRWGFADDTSGESCTLLSEASGSMPLPACPAWVMPNADAAGYYQWSLPADQLRAISGHGIGLLNVRERMSFANAVQSAYAAGKLDYADALSLLLPLVDDFHPHVAGAPLALLSQSRQWMLEDGDGARAQSIEKATRDAYGPIAAKLGGFTTRADDDPERRLLRERVMGAMVGVGQDAKTRKRARELAAKYLGVDAAGLQRDAVDPNLAGLVMYVYGEEANAKDFDALLYRFDNARDEVVRGHMLMALGAARQPDVAARARELVLHPVLKANEVMQPLQLQLHGTETRRDAWAWLVEHIDELMEMLPPRRAGWLPSAATVFCSEADAAATDALFRPRLQQMAGGKRELDKALEEIRTCAALRQAQTPSIQARFKP